jgi:S-methylmethionine-dependent homocysteine/selenocysteine methylase
VKWGWSASALSSAAVSAQGAMPTRTNATITTAAAQDYHSEQVGKFKQANVDLITALS